jgi:hypothetical protein
VMHIEILDPNRRSIYINHELATME